MNWMHIPTEEEKALKSLEHELESVYGLLEAAEHHVHLTAFSVGLVGFFFGTGFGMLIVNAINCGGR